MASMTILSKTGSYWKGTPYPGLEDLPRPDFKAMAAAKRAGYRPERSDKLKRGGCITPYPVYEARYADGTTSRLSFWSAPGKPINFARGYNVSMLLWGMTPVHGEVAGVVDPYFSGAKDLKARKPTLKEQMGEIAELLRSGLYDEALACADAALCR